MGLHPLKSPYKKRPLHKPIQSFQFGVCDFVMTICLAVLLMFHPRCTLRFSTNKISGGRTKCGEQHREIAIRGTTSKAGNPPWLLIQTLGCNSSATNGAILIKFSRAGSLECCPSYGCTLDIRKLFQCGKNSGNGIKDKW